ncbi:MAG: hypothetical protein JXB43_02585 [Dehalococcoidia bacterium]|nr:hypothetical protein [Dehalococcoidia bacterium]
MDKERLGQELRDYFKTEVKKAEPSPEWWNKAISRLSEHKKDSRSEKTAFWKLRPSLITVPLSIFLLVILLGSFIPMLGGMAPPPPSAPAMVSDGSGGAFLIWLDNPWHPDAAVRAQYVDAQGNLMWGEDGRQLATGYAGQPYAVGDDNGGIIIAWKDDSGIHLNKLGPDGHTIWVLESFSSRSVVGMVEGGSGGAILLLYDPDDGISAQRVSSEGVILWGENGTFLSNTQEVSRGTFLVSDGLGGAVIIWQKQSGMDMEIRAQRLSPAGLPLWVDYGVIVTSREQSQGNNRDVVTDDMGNFFIAWDTELGISGAPDSDIYVQKLDGNGNKQWGEEGILVCQNQETEPRLGVFDMQSHPKMAADGSGGVIITWHDRRRIMNREVFAQRINAEGEMLWTENGVWVWNIPAEYFMTTSGILDANVIPDGAGGATIVWTGYKESYSRNSVIYAQGLSPDGQRLWDIEEVYPEPRFRSQGYSSIISDGQGGVIIGSRVGKSSSVSKTDSVYAQRISPDGDRIWGESGLEIQKVPAALTIYFIAAVAILAAILVIFGVFRRNWIAGIFTAILPVLLGIAGLFSILLVIGPFGYTYGWAYIPDTTLNKLLAFLIPFAGLVIVVVGIRKKTVTKWIMIPVLVFCTLISVIAGLVFIL